MKRYITFVLAAVALVGVTSCSIDNGIATPDGEGQMALRFESSSMTRATVDGIDDLNENLIKTIDCYFYPASATEDTEAVWYQQFTFGTDGAGVNTTASVTDVLMPSGNMTAVFGSGTTGKIYAIANYAGGAALPTSGENTTVAKLKDMVVTTAWLDNSNFKEQTSFVMDSEMTTITKAQGNAISGTVPLNRTAAKVELTITGVEDAVSSTVANADGTTTTTWWVPAIVDSYGKPSGAYVTMYNARTAAGVGGAPQAYSEATSLNLESYGFNSGSLYKQTNPFYTYPHSWSTDDEKASLLLVVYWQATDKASKDDNDYKLVGDAQPCYYEIPIGAADNTEILRNHIYQIGINVGTLGSFVKEDPVQLTPRYMVVDWGSGNISANIKGQRYLVVDQNKVEIYNQSTAEIAFASSHDVVVTIDKIVYKNYANKDTRTITITSNSKTSVTEGSTSSSNFTGDSNAYADYKLPNTSTVELDKNAGYINFNHVMSANTFVPHEITLTIQHKDNASFSETIVITQYPPIYIVGDRSDGNVFVNGYGKNTTNYNDNRNSIGSLPSSLGSGVNSNPNQYNIYVTSLPATSTYIIGDPRVMEGGKLANINGVDNYRPTREDAINIVAPIFKIASSWGKTQQFGYQRAVERCASYQENGYPAGRWRVPTQAEIEFMQDRVNNGDIPSLFNGVSSTDGYRGYWASSRYMYWPAYGSDGNSIGNYPAGFYNPEDNDDFSINNNGVRCVYDVWYWGDGKISNPGTFTFAD